MYNYFLHQQAELLLKKYKIDRSFNDKLFCMRLSANLAEIKSLFNEIYLGGDDEKFNRLLATIIQSYKDRSENLRERDLQKLQQGHWFLSNKLTGMSLYVDRFCGKIQGLSSKLGYIKILGVNLLHLMPVFQSPAGESDGGYAVSDFRKIDPRFGTINDLKKFSGKLLKDDMYLMLDIVLNHTSHRHEWAEKAKAGDKKYQDYFYMFPDRHIPDEFDKNMPDIFPESAPGNFTFVPECNKWVMTVFHNYQWDLNYSNPNVFIDMLDNVLYYANLGVDILRIDAPAFIWKQIGTACQNLPHAHLILQLIKQCTNVAAPGMALLGEAIVAPKEIIKYFGDGHAKAKECDFAYNATQMALQWDAIATGDIRVMYAAQKEILKKPKGTTWITYTRCHDDIGLGYEDYMITSAGFNAYEHRKFLKDYYSGNYISSPATGALFSVNPKTQDARISGTLASLCGLEKALGLDGEPNQQFVTESVNKIILMQAMSFFIGGVPMLFYGDEAGYTNDYSFLKDKGKSYDNRWMHRPLIDWKKNKQTEKKGTVENMIFLKTKKLISLRKKLNVLADHNNLLWLPPRNQHLACFLRHSEETILYCIFNFKNSKTQLTWYAFKEHGVVPETLYDHWNDAFYNVGRDEEYFVIEPYGFHILEVQKSAIR